MQQNAFEKIIPWIIKIGLFVVTVLPLYVSGTMLFPFITGKNFLFREIVEIIFALWIGLIAISPRYRLRPTMPLKLSFVFIAILFFADLFGPNPYRSFFSNYERMEGFLMIFHLWLYFLMLSSVLKTRKDWLIFFHTTLLTSILVAIGGFLQKLGFQISIQGGFRVDSTIGNPAYLAAYLSFHVWILLLLLREFWRNWWLRALYGIALFFELLIIYFTATRGAFIAIMFSAILLFFFLVLWWGRIFGAGGRKYRMWAGVFLGVLLLIPVLFWFLRDTDFIRSNLVLNRIASISLEDRTTQSRFSIWHMSLQGVKDRPLLGWGQENYYLVFQKYYDPKLYASEPWFDRSHNIVFDWLVHAGVLGFLGFFSFLGAGFWGLIRAIRRKSIDFWKGAVLLTGFASYFIQDLFVFDNLNTYLLLFAFLAYTDVLTGEEKNFSGDVLKNKNSVYSSSSNGLRFWPLLCGMGVLVSISSYQFFWKPMQESKALIRALQIEQRAHSVKIPMDTLIGAFQEALAYKSFGDTEVREQLSDVARGIVNNQRYTPEEQARFLFFAVEEMRKQVASPAKDVKHILFLASDLSAGLQFNSAYAQETESLLREALELSPNKHILYFELGQLYLRAGKYAEALEVLKVPYALSPDFEQARVNYMIGAVFAQKQEIVSEVFGAWNLKRASIESLERIGQFFRSPQVKYYAFARPIYEELIARIPNSASYHATLGALYGELGEYDRAIEEAQSAAKLDDSFAAEAATFIQVMRAKKGGK